MIELNVRLCYIGDISKFVIDRHKIASVWIDKKNGITSVTDFDELYEQLFGDLDMSELERDLPKLEEIDPITRDRIFEFLKVFRMVDKKVTTIPSLSDPRILLKSDVWKQFELACKAVLEMPLIQTAMKELN
jgi:hypothetical protein